MARPRADVLVTGAGSLASAIGHVFSTATRAPLHLVIASRPSSRLDWLSRSVAAAATSLGSGLIVNTEAVDWSDEALRQLLVSWHPRLVIHTASLQSPWSLGGDDEWCRLVRSAGYGLTLPLHLALARRIGRAILETSPESLFINACYPDAANRMLKADGVPILCGIGNVAILASLMSLDESIPLHDVQLLAHHCHVAEAISPTARSTSAISSLRAWRKGLPMDEAAKAWLRHAQIPSDQRLNRVTAASAVSVVMSLLGRAPPCRANLPGPLGLPGGYPVAIGCGTLEVAVPSTMDRSEAIKLNESSGWCDGVSVGDRGHALFSEQATAAVEAVFPNFRSATLPFPCDESEQRADMFVTLRTKLGGA